MFNRIKMAFMNRFIFNHFKPKIVLLKRRPFDNKKLRFTRISNTSAISNLKKLEIEDNVYISHFCTLDASNGLVIGEGCQICSNVIITTHSSHISIRLYGKEYTNHINHIGYIKARIEIGAYTFIGANSIIMPGVILGKGSIIKAFSYVKKGNYPDFSIIEGNPAKIVGDTRIIDKPFLEDNSFLNNLYTEWVENYEK